MPTTVRAAVVDRAGAPPVVQEIQLADLRPNEVLVDVAMCGICHTDVAWQSGELMDQFPVVPGHEVAGTIADVGSNVSRVHKGQRVVLSLASHCGHCLYCETGMPMLCDGRTDTPPRMFRDGQPLVQGFETGGFSEQTIMKDIAVIPIPDDVPFEIASIAGCAVATGMGAAINIARVRPGSTVVVFGCGGIGVNVIMGARISGAERIVAVDPADDRRKTALRFGATDAVEPSEDVLREIAPNGFDYAFECAGKVKPMEMAIGITRKAGTIVLIGATKPDETISFNALDFVVSQKRILGCLTGSLRPNIDFDMYFRLYRRGLLPLDALASGTVPLDDIASGFARSAAGDGIRTIVTMQ